MKMKLLLLVLLPVIPLANGCCPNYMVPNAEECCDLDYECGNGGHCQSYCSTWQEDIGDCDQFSDSCQCCRDLDCVSTSSACGSGGHCSVSCNSFEDEIGDCPGVSCSCCKHKDCVVSIGSACGSGGHCSVSCTSSEDVIGGCPGASCSCCKEKDCYSPGSSCGDGGTCSTGCNSNQQEITGVCGGGSCKCCKQNSESSENIEDCTSTGSSCGYGDDGICSYGCNPFTQDEIVGYCGGGSCNCCKQKVTCGSGGHCSTSTTSCDPGMSSTPGVCYMNALCCKIILG